MNKYENINYWWSWDIRINIVKQFEIEKIPYRLIDNFETGSVDNIKGIPEEKLLKKHSNTPLTRKNFP